MSISSESSDFGDAIPIGSSNAPFVGDVYAGHESQRLDSGVESSIFTNDDNNDSSFAAGNDVFASQPSNYGDYANGGSDGSNLPPPSEMVPEEGLALREWRRDNAVRLEEKEKKEKAILSQVIEEADEYKVEFYRKRVIACENNVVTNREREKSVVASQKKFHDEADKNYWKSIAELIPNEVPSLEKRKGKKGQQETKPSVVALQGPKPGKPTDLSRMRQLLVKLKHDTPAHLKPSPPPIAPTTKDAETVATSTEVVAVA